MNMVSKQALNMYDEGHAPGPRVMMGLALASGRTDTNHCYQEQTSCLTYNIALL